MAKNSDVLRLCGPIILQMNWANRSQKCYLKKEQSGSGYAHHVKEGISGLEEEMEDIDVENVGLYSRTFQIFEKKSSCSK